MTEINNGIIKMVRSLGVKKYRDDERLFVAEGTKCAVSYTHLTLPTKA